MFGKIRKELQCLEGWDKNSNVWKGGKNSNVFKDNSRNQMFGRIKKMSVSGKIRKEHICLKKWDKNSNNWKNKIKTLIFGKIT